MTRKRISNEWSKIKESIPVNEQEQKSQRLGILLAEFVMMETSEAKEAKFYFDTTRSMDWGVLSKKEIKRHNNSNHEFKITTYDEMEDQMYELFGKWLHQKGLAHEFEDHSFLWDF